MVPPILWQPYRRGFTPGSGPNPLLLDSLLAQQGFELTVLDPYPRPWNPFGGMNSVLQSLDPLRALRILARERRFDLVVSVFEGNALPLLLLRRLFGFRTPIVLWDIGLTENWRLRERILNFVVPRIDGIMVLAASQKAYIEKRWAPTCPVTVVGHSIDVDFYQPSAQQSEDYIFSVGNDVSRDYRTLLRATEQLDVRLLLRTNVPVEIEAPRLRDPEVLARAVSFRELRDLYSKAGMVVLPLRESLNAGGVSGLLEAAAMGKPMIVSKTEALREFLIPEMTCLLVPPGDPAAMRGAIDRLRAAPDLASRLGLSARRFVVDHYSLPAFAGRLARAMTSFIEHS